MWIATRVESDNVDLILAASAKISAKVKAAPHHNDLRSMKFANLSSARLEMAKRRQSLKKFAPVLIEMLTAEWMSLGLENESVSVNYLFSVLKLKQSPSLILFPRRITVKKTILWNKFNQVQLLLHNSL